MSNSFKARQKKLATMFFVAKVPVRIPNPSIPGQTVFIGFSNGRTYRKEVKQ